MILKIKGFNNKRNRKNIIVLYLSTTYSKVSDLKKFIGNYKKYKSGCNHKLIICFKKLNKKELSKRIKIIKNISYVIDTEINNDHEWGSLKRFCQIFRKNYIFFLNDYSYPITNSWLKHFDKLKKTKKILGCTSSKSSHSTNSFYKHKNDNVFYFVLKIIYFYFTVPRFPNPHLRVNAFLIKAQDYLEFYEKKNISYKIQSLILESGYNGLTQFFKKRNYQIQILDKFGKAYELNESYHSKTFASHKLEGLIISDKQTRAYEKLNIKKRLKKTKQCWG